MLVAISTQKMRIVCMRRYCLICHLFSKEVEYLWYVYGLSSKTDVTCHIDVECGQFA